MMKTLITLILIFTGWSALADYNEYKQVYNRVDSVPMGQTNQNYNGQNTYGYNGYNSNGGYNNYGTGQGGFGVGVNPYQNQNAPSYWQVTTSEDRFQEFMALSTNDIGEEEYVSRLAGILSYGQYGSAPLSQDQKLRLISHVHSQGIDLTDDKFNKFDEEVTAGLIGGDYSRQAGSPVCMAMNSLIPMPWEAEADLTLIEAIANGKDVGNLVCGNKTVKEHMKELYKQTQKFYGESDLQSVYTGLYIEDGKSYLESLGALLGKLKSPKSNKPTSEVRIKTSSAKQAVQLTEGVELVYDSVSEGCENLELRQALNELRSVIGSYEPGANVVDMRLDNNCSRSYHMSADVSLNTATRRQAERNLQRVFGGNR